MIAQLGYEVRTASSATTALEATEESPFDLIVSDIVMAGAMDGLGLARVLRHSQPDLPIVLVSGYSQSAAAADIEFTMLAKPFQVADLSRAIAQATGEISAAAGGNVVRLKDVKQRPARLRPPESD